jgi:hypothetical protein
LVLFEFISTRGKNRSTICAVAKVDEANNRIICLTKKGIGLFTKQKMNLEDILKAVSNAYVIPFNEILNVKAT